MVPGVDLRDNLDFLHVVTYFGPNGEYGGPFTVANNLCVETQKKRFKSTNYLWRIRRVWQ